MLRDISQWPNYDFQGRNFDFNLVVTTQFCILICFSLATTLKLTQLFSVARLGLPYFDDFYVILLFLLSS